MKTSVPIPEDILAVIFVTVFLFLYVALLQFENTFGIAMLMFLASPFLLVWMVITVLRSGKYNGPALGENEFGYQDKNKDEPRTF
jgi:hypothetical protein